MTKMEFRNKALEKIFRGFKWARNNSIQMLDSALENKILDIKLEDNKFTFQPIRHQFQCLVSTTDTYFRQLSGSNNQAFGILVSEDHETIKSEISEEHLIKLLKEQLAMLEELFRSFNNKDFEENIKAIQSLSNHEYLHQGQLLLLFRQAGIDVPERFKQAFAL